MANETKQFLSLDGLQKYDALIKAEMVTAVDAALSNAKTSGEFDGEDGYTPVRGTDYWTEADKAEIKAYVDEAILGGAW